MTCKNMFWSNSWTEVKFDESHNASVFPFFLISDSIIKIKHKVNNIKPSITQHLSILKYPFSINNLIQTTNLDIKNSGGIFF